MANSASHCAACGTVFEARTESVPKIHPYLPRRPAGPKAPIGWFIGGPVVVVLAGALLYVFIIRPTSLPGKVSTPTITKIHTPSVTLTSLPANTPTISTTPSPPPPIIITVAAGDTCYGLAEKYGYKDFGVMTDENGRAVDCDNLQPGDVIHFPPATPTLLPASETHLYSRNLTDTACPIAVYIVDYGDTLIGIAAGYHVTIESIKRWNPQYSFANDEIWEGMELIIPLCEQLPSESATPNL
jgi:LysM repeat protein